MLLLRKLYHTDRSHKREKGTGADRRKEGKLRDTPTVVCAPPPYAHPHGAWTARPWTVDCTRMEHVPAPKGDAIIALREKIALLHRDCLPPGAFGPCIYEPPPKPPPPPPPPPPGAQTIDVPISATTGTQTIDVPVSKKGA